MRLDEFDELFFAEAPISFSGSVTPSLKATKISPPCIAMVDPS